MSDLAKLFDVYQNNVFPVMLELLAEDLGVKVTSLQTLGVGFYPAYQAWVFAERDAKGDVVGLKYRCMDGRKYYEKGSKPGLTYSLSDKSDDKKYIPGRTRWVRIADAGVACPVCGKFDWCRVSPDNPQEPAAVLCSRISEGADKIISENNYLHILDPERNPIQKNASVLPQSDLPILIVEGATDVLAALDLGFTAIGRPSAKGGLKELRKMLLTGKKVWIIGENDVATKPDGKLFYPGKEGTEATFVALRDCVVDLSKVMPPKEIKDLRKWVINGLTQEALITYVEQHGEHGVRLDPNMFDSDAAFPIARRFLKMEHTIDGVPTLRYHRGRWLTWDGGCYVEITEPSLRGGLYRFLEGKKFIKETATGPSIAEYKPTASKIRDILDALYAWCPVEEDPPVWLCSDGMDPRNLIAFNNGLLDVNEYLKGNIVLHDPDPAYFSMCVLPYDFDPDLKSDILLPTLEDIFNGDESVIRHLKEWCGYQLTPDMSMEKMMLFTGRTRCGKGTVLEAMIGMLGRKQCISTDFQSLASQFGRVPLVGKLAATLGDAKTPRSGEADAALETILRIVGRDPIQIRPLYQQGYDAYLSTRFTVAMNGLPAFTDHAKALAARMNVIDFPNCYEGREDTTLKTRLKRDAESGKLVTWALEGLRSLRERGKFEIPEVSKGTLADMISITSPISTFIDECCLLVNGKTASMQMVYEAYQRWCGENGRKAGGNTMFIRNVLAECPSVSKKRTQETERREYEYDGLALQQWVFDKYLGRPQ